MKKILFTVTIAALSIGLLGSCSKLENRIGEAEKRLDNIETNELTNINASIESLEKVKDVLTEKISTLEKESSNYATEILKLKAQVASLDRNLDGLYEYADSLNKAVKDWASIKFATANALKEVQDSLISLKKVVDSIPDPEDVAEAIAEATEVLTQTIAALDGRIGALEKMIQAVTIVPAYSDGSVEAKNGTLTMNIIVSPASSLDSIKTGTIKDSLTVLAATVNTKAGSGLYTEIKAASASILDAAEGSVRLTANVSGVTPASGKSLMVAVRIKNGVSNFTTDFVNVTATHEIPAGALSGQFSVSETKKVWFSKGNIWYSKNAAAGSRWAFESKQYYFHTYPGYGCCLNGVEYSTTTGNPDNTYGLFGRGDAPASGDITTIKDEDAYSVTFAGSDPWGSKIDNKGTWRTMTRTDAVYLIEDRAGARYAKVKVKNVPGLLIFPDNTLTITENKVIFNGVMVDGVNVSDADFTAVSDSDWTKIENGGAAFLPAAGGRMGVEVGMTGQFGGYWLSTSKSYGLVFQKQGGNNNVNPQDSSWEWWRGGAVRLVSDAN